MAKSNRNRVFPAPPSYWLNSGEQAIKAPTPAAYPAAAPPIADTAAPAC